MCQLHEYKASFGFATDYDAWQGTEVGAHFTMWLLSLSICSSETSRSAVDGTPSSSICIGSRMSVMGVMPVCMQEPVLLHGDRSQSVACSGQG